MALAPRRAKDHAKLWRSRRQRQGSAASRCLSRQNPPSFPLEARRGYFFVAALTRSGSSSAQATGTFKFTLPLCPITLGIDYGSNSARAICRGQFERARTRDLRSGIPPATTASCSIRATIMLPASIRELVLGSHMLEVCPSIAAGKPSVEIHPLASPE